MLLYDLANTTWSYSFEEDGEVSSIYYAFKSNGLVEVGISGDLGWNTTSFAFMGTYEYEAPNVVIRYEVEGEPCQIAGTVKGDRMILNDEGEEVVFTSR